MPSYDLPGTNEMRTPQNDLVEAYKAQYNEDITVQDAVLRLHKSAEEVKRRRQEEEDGFWGQFPWRPEYDPQKYGPNAVQRSERRQNAEPFEDSMPPVNEPSRFISLDGEELRVNEDLLESLHLLLGGDEARVLIEGRDQTESGAINEQFQGDIQERQYDGSIVATNELLKTVEVEDTGKSIPKEKGRAEGDGDGVLTESDNDVQDIGYSPSPANNFSTEPNLIHNGAGGDVENRNDHSHRMNEVESSLIDREEYEGSARPKIGVIDNESEIDNDGGRNGLKEDHREKRLPGDGMTAEAEIQSIPEDLEAEEYPIQYQVPAIAPQNSASSKTRKIDQAGGVPQGGPTVATRVQEVQAPRIRHQQQPIAPSGPIALRDAPQTPHIQQRAKTGPRPYVPPAAIAAACQERLATSLRELIPYLKRNLRPARPASAPGKYAKHARPIVQIPDANNIESMRKALEKLLDSNYASMFRSFVEVTIDQERKKLGKPPVFQETAEKKLGDGKVDGIDIAVRKLLRRQIRDDKTGTPASQASSSMTQALHAPGDMVVPQSSQQTQDTGFPTSANSTSSYPSMTAVAIPNSTHRMPRAPYGSTYPNPNGPNTPQNFPFSTPPANLLPLFVFPGTASPTAARIPPSSLAIPYGQFDNPQNYFHNRLNQNQQDTTSFSRPNPPVGHQSLSPYWGYGQMGLRGAVHANGESDLQTGSRAGSTVAESQGSHIEQRGSSNSGMRYSAPAGIQNAPIAGLNTGILTYGFEAHMTEFDANLPPLAHEAVSGSIKRKSDGDEEEESAGHTKRCRMT